MLVSALWPMRLSCSLVLLFRFRYYLIYFLSSFVVPGLTSQKEIIFKMCISGITFAWRVPFLGYFLGVWTIINSKPLTSPNREVSLGAVECWICSPTCMDYSRQKWTTSIHTSTIYQVSFFLRKRSSCVRSIRYLIATAHPSTTRSISLVRWYFEKYVLCIYRYSST